MHFHSPAATALLESDLGEVKGKAKAKAKPGAAGSGFGKMKMAGLKLDKCRPAFGKAGKMSCERGIHKCIKVMGKQIGCMGVGAFVFADYGLQISSTPSAHAEASAGFQVEFMKYHFKLLDTQNKFQAKGMAGSLVAHAKYFNVKSRKEVTIYSINKHFGSAEELGDSKKAAKKAAKKAPAKKGAAGLMEKINAFKNKGKEVCSADQASAYTKTKQMAKTFFTVEACYGIPKVASICGQVGLSGKLGLTMGAGLVMPTKLPNAATLGLKPFAEATLSVEASGQALGFKGYVKGNIQLIGASLPATALINILKRNGGVNLKWVVNFLKVDLTVGIKGPGIAKPKGCKEVEDTENKERLGDSDELPEGVPMHLMQEWGPEVKTLGDNSNPQLGEKWLVNLKCIPRPCTGCKNFMGPKPMMKYAGQKLSGNILDKKAC